MKLMISNIFLFPPGGVFLMQWYDPLNKFMLLKHFECSITNPPRVFEMIITPDLEYPIGKYINGHFTVSKQPQIETDVLQVLKEGIQNETAFLGIQCLLKILGGSKWG